VIRITALYPNTPGSRFDADYYLDKHSRYAIQLLSPHGLRSIRTTTGTASLDGSPPPFWTISEMIFDSRGAFDAAMAECGATLFADLPNYTDSTPVMQLSELHGD
jgi:uncharacterized protein (TIGR02118 family)